jgi:glutamate synthase (NADPH) large chain
MTSEEKSLYDSRYEHDACGIGMVVNIQGKKSHQLIESALTVLENMQHRGAEGADGKSGDGAGIMVQIPHEFTLLQGVAVPEKGKYGTGLVFLPKEEERRNTVIELLTEEINNNGFRLLHVRPVPVNTDCIGEVARESEPLIMQIFVVPSSDAEGMELERKLYLLRKSIELRIHDADFYVVSLSSTHIIYKGMLTSKQLKEYFLDLQDPNFTSGLALVHSRFSTNTFPRWSLAQPFRMLAHNGEINTIRGNRGWMKARESLLSTPELGDVRKLTPIIQPDMSDSASLDNVLEFLVMSGLSLPKAMSILIPESFNDKNPIGEDLKNFYEYHSILMEPWDGPAALIFSDGRYAGGMLDRNGLRPARYTITSDGMIVVASEVGVMDFDPTKIVEKGRLQPGKLLIIDTEEGKIYYDGEIKKQLAQEHPYGQWLSTNCIQLEKLHSGRKVSNSVDNLPRKMRAFGFGMEDIERTIVPMCVNGVEPTAAMGNDTPLAVVSDRPQTFFNYFRQQFAQVTNPAIDPIREELVMSLTEYVGGVGHSILTPDSANCKMVRLPHPIINNTQLDLLCNIEYKGFRTQKLPMVFEISRGKQGLQDALQNLCEKAAESVEQGINYIILSDRFIDETHAVIPSLLAVSAVHHYLIALGRRVQTALIVESGEIKETMHAALLLGYGASAINPYMVFAVIDDLVNKHKIQENYEMAEKNYIKAVCKGFLKIMSKMGISTIRSYRGAKLFESIGLGKELLRKYFGTDSSSIGGIDLEQIALDSIAMHNAAFDTTSPVDKLPPLKNNGQFSYRKDGIPHAWTPDVISKLQLSTRLGDYKMFKDFTDLVDHAEKPIFIRDLFDFKKAQKPIDIDKVESEDSIVKRFVTGAMSFGALSKEAHETIALAMNKLGSRSNTGEGGEDSERFTSTVDGVSLSSKTKQIASGRFGVTTNYLVNAEEIQIKVAQGAKPGEGGQLPGFKVNEVIAKTRHSIPGISLISPPPHHDIYSIEDLSQLIFDLKCVNPTAAVSVKLVAESGVGTVAAGVAKANADLIVISGAEGGTGASPASSMRYAGIPPEIGLSETQQTLTANGLRQQVRLQTDGQLKTGRDVIMMALLGADEFAFGTLPLIVMGCVMMRKCNTNTCPMGVATQDPNLRKHFAGKPEYIINYFHFLARQVRGYLSEMGFEKFEDIIGRTDLIVTKDNLDKKARTLDFSRLLAMDDTAAMRHFDHRPFNQIPKVLDDDIIQELSDSIARKSESNTEYTIKNTDRAVGTKLSGYIEKKYGTGYLTDSTVNIKFKGAAGQSFGAFLIQGVNFCLEGEANDYVGKGLSGGRIAIKPSRRCSFKAEDNMIVGNTGIYGATSGEIYINGRVGERFAVRNSGAVAVVEGAGDHCCEYMTGGRVVVLGETGSNFAAGMSGGIAYVWNKNQNFDYFCNMEMVELSLLDESSSRNELRELIHRHWTYTDSQLARRMLDDWQHYADQFIQVIPIEYKKVMQDEKDRVLRERINNIWMNN